MRPALLCGIALAIGVMAPFEAAAKESFSADVTYVARDYSLTGPDTVPNGMVAVRIRNEGHDLHQIQFIRLPEGKTAAAFSTQINANPSRLPKWVQRRGGPNSVAPGEEALAVIGLEPGDYVLICGIPDEHG